jgi:hypothetical protein
MSPKSDEMMVTTLLVFNAVDSYSALHSKVYYHSHKSLCACTGCIDVYVYTPFFVSMLGIKGRQK